MDTASIGTFSIIAKGLGLTSLHSVLPLIVLMLLIVLIIYVIVSFIGKPINLKLGSFAIVMGNNQKIDDGKYLVERTKNIVEKSIIEQKTIENEIMIRQINFANERIVEINNIMTEPYAELLIKKLSDDNIRSGIEYRNYRMLVQMMTNDCIKERVLVRALKENHLAAMEGIAWDDFVKQKVDVTISLLSNYLDLMYSGNNIDRYELSKLNESNRYEVCNMIASIYDVAKKITIKSYENIATIKLNTEEEISKLF